MVERVNRTSPWVPLASVGAAELVQHLREVTPLWSDHPPTHLRSLPLFVWRVVVVVIGTSCLGKHCERYSMLQCGYNMVGNTMCVCFGGLMCVYAGWGFTLSLPLLFHIHTPSHPHRVHPLPTHYRGWGLANGIHRRHLGTTYNIRHFSPLQ